MNQNERVLKYMKDFGSITQMEAITDLGVMRLASRVSDLKRSGHRIKSELVASKNRYGEPIRFAKYSIVEVEN